MQKPETLVRIALAEEKSIEDVRSRYQEVLAKLRDEQHSDYKRYFVYNQEKSYLFLILRAKERETRRYGEPHSFIFAFTSESEETNKELAKNFSDKTEIHLKKAPEILEKNLEDALNRAFCYFKEGKKDALDYLCSNLLSIDF